MRRPTHADKQSETSVPDDDSAFGAFLARGNVFLVNVARAMDREALRQAAAAPTSYDFLARTVAASHRLVGSAPDDPLAPALLRGIEARARLLGAEGRPLGVVEVARILGKIGRASCRERV